jgi:hypothetical protein
LFLIYKKKDLILVMKLTIGLIIVNITVFFISVILGIQYGVNGLEYAAMNFGFQPRAFLEGRIYTVFTSLFLHADILHLGFNMIALFLLGTSLESKVERKKYLAAYFIGGMMGNLVMLIPFLYSPETIGIGASGAISALVGLGTFLCPGKLVIFPSVIPLPFVVAGALYFLSTAINLFIPSQIGYPVHMVSMFAGALFGLVWAENRKRSILIFVVTLILIVLLPYILAAIF